MSTKFIDNRYIEEYANGDSVMSKCVTTIKKILKKEADNISDEDKETLNCFGEEEGIHLDEYKNRKKLECQSADIVTILGEREVLIADAKLNISGGSSLYKNQGRRPKGQYTDSVKILETNPNYSKMGLVPIPDMYVILPTTGFEFIKYQVNRSNLTDPKLVSCRIKDFYEKFFNNTTLTGTLQEF